VFQLWFNNGGSHRWKGWWRLIGANPAVDGDLRCSGPTKRCRGDEGEAAGLSDLTGMLGKGDRSTTLGTGAKENGEKRGQRGAR
jgi:hypothetical protein